MAALKLDMTIPLGNAGHVHLLIDITDITTLDAAGRAFLADTCAEVCTLGRHLLAPRGHAIAATAELGELPPATTYDPHLDVLKGVLGTRRNTS